jgi:hypothetical protein
MRIYSSAPLLAILLLGVVYFFLLAGFLVEIFGLTIVRPSVSGFGLGFEVLLDLLTTISLKCLMN